MLGNRAMIGKLSGFYISGSWSRVADMGSTTSPRGPLDLKVESPGGLKKYDLGGVGIGIVAALEKSSDAGREILAKYALCSASINRFCPKPVSSIISTRKHSSGLKDELEEFDSSEDYTYVTCHGHKNSTAKVYYDGGCPPPDSLARQHRDGFEKFSHLGQFKNSQNRCTGHSEYPVSDSLSSCHLCRKNLQGQDIYMYRGEKGFCSPECRSRQILIDERKEVEQ